MTEQQQPYVEFKPGDLIAAEVFNDLQGQIRGDIAAQTQAAVDGITQVPRSGDSEKLEGLSLDEIRQSIIDEAVGEISRRSGYMKLFKKLRTNEWKIVEHGLQNCPLVDLYQLLYFRVVASEDDYKYITWVNFYIYHSSEKRIRFAEEGSPVESVQIEPTDGPAYRYPLKEMLRAYKVDYTDDSAMVDVETDFWDAIFAGANDTFDDNQYTHSPWFDRCCREERTIRSLKQRGDWDDLWVKMIPSRTVNYPYQLVRGNDEQGNRVFGVEIPNQADPLPRPTQLEVAHFDLNTLGLKLLHNPIPQLDVQQARENDATQAEVEHIREDELKVMLLLRA